MGKPAYCSQFCKAFWVVFDVLKAFLEGFLSGVYRGLVTQRLIHDHHNRILHTVCVPFTCKETLRTTHSVQ